MEEIKEYEKRNDNNGDEWRKINADEEITSINKLSSFLNVNNGSIMVRYLFFYSQNFDDIYYKFKYKNFTIILPLFTFKKEDNLFIEVISSSAFIFLHSSPLLSFLFSYSFISPFYFNY